MKRIALLVLATLVFASAPAPAQEPAFYQPGQRVVFLGDSNTYAGHFLVYLEAELRCLYPDREHVLLNVGLPSETASGLSEPDHPFPRPDVHERLDRVLAKTKPDIVVAGYGMNDGIYHPFDKERFEAYQKGIRKLVDKAKKAGAKVMLLTPSMFDPLPMKKNKKLLPKGAPKYAWFSIYENYDAEVLAAYAKWIMEQKDKVDLVIDIHTPMLEFTNEKRKTDPNYTLCGDAIHYNAEGHRLVANAILKSWGLSTAKPADRKLIDLVTKRQFLLRDAWLTHTEHRRPGIKKGLPLEEATREAAKLDAEIRKALN
jgi:lysophospholipase L1-like esterase